MSQFEPNIDENMPVRVFEPIPGSELLPRLFLKEKVAILETLKKMTGEMHVPEDTKLENLTEVLAKHLFKNGLSTEEHAFLVKNFQTRKEFISDDHAIGEVPEDLMQIGSDRGKALLESLIKNGLDIATSKLRIKEVVDVLENDTKVKTHYSNPNKETKIYEPLS